MKPKIQPDIRDAAPGDATAVALIVNDIFAEYGMTFELEGWDKDLMAPHLHYAAPRSVFRVAELDGKIIGMAGAHLEDTHAELHRLYISAAVRGRGLGRLLCHEIESWVHAREINRLTLWSDVRLTHAHALYRSLGYQIFASRIINDPDRSVEFGMERDLARPSTPANAPLMPTLGAIRNVSCNMAASDAVLWHKISAAAATTLLQTAKLGTSEALVAGAGATAIVAGFSVQTKTGGREILWHPSCKH